MGAMLRILLFSGLCLYVACANREEVAVPGSGDAAPTPEVGFPDYDCIRIPRNEAVLDWATFFNDVLAFVELKPGDKAKELHIGSFGHGSSGPSGSSGPRDAASSEPASAGLDGLVFHWEPEVGRLWQTSWFLAEGSAVRRAARQQCPLGLLCLCVLEATALASKHTEDLPPKFACIQELLAELPVFVLAGAKWPTFRLLDFFWGLNKIPIREHGYKNLNRFVQRQYADFVFTIEELAPFGVGRSVHWSSWLSAGPGGAELISDQLDQLAQASRGSFNSFGPALRALGAAAWESLHRDGRGANQGRPVVRVSLVYGEQWARLMPVAWARWAAVGFRAAVFVAMDKAAQQSCRDFSLICVPSGAASILNKYTLTTLALHLGVDVLYCDLDAVPVGHDPFGAIQAALQDDQHVSGSADLPELAVSTHNYDCLNAGFWFARASATTATFFLLMLEYLYEHWYEGDQRTFNAFSTGNTSVSFAAGMRTQLPSLRTATLSPDVFGGTDGLQNLEALEIFHAYRIYDNEKLELVRALYGVNVMAPSVATSRSLLWQWAKDSAKQAEVQEAARSALKSFVRPRTSTSCW